MWILPVSKIECRWKGNLIRHWQVKMQVKRGLNVLVYCSRLEIACNTLAWFLLCVDQGIRVCVCGGGQWGGGNGGGAQWGVAQVACFHGKSCCRGPSGADPLNHWHVWGVMATKETLPFTARGPDWRVNVKGAEPVSMWLTDNAEQV